mgnify:CR=1 FL=1
MALEKKLGDTVIRRDRNPAETKSYFDTAIYQEGEERQYGGNEDQYGGNEDQYYTEKTTEYGAKTRDTASLAEQYKPKLPGENTQSQYVRLNQKDTENKLETEVREERSIPRQDKRYEVPYQRKEPSLQTKQETEDIKPTKQETDDIKPTKQETDDIKPIKQETKIKNPLKTEKITKQLKPKTREKIIKWKTKIYQKE